MIPSTSYALMHLFQLLDIERPYNDTTDMKLHASSYCVVKMS
jgi:hypothetical protein